MIRKSNIMLLGISTSICSILLFETSYQIAASQSFIRKRYANLPLHDYETHYCRGPQKKFQFDALREYIEVPNHQYFVYRNWNVRFHSYNNHGYRSNSPNGKDKTDITDINKTIWVFGDSFTKGSLADNSETIPSQLTRLSKNDITFINFGVSGNGFLNALRHLEWASKYMKYKPLAILHIGHSNDIQNDQRTFARLKEVSNFDFQSKNKDQQSSRIKNKLKRIPYLFSRLSAAKYIFNRYIVIRIKRNFNRSVIRHTQEEFKLAQNHYSQFLEKAQSISSRVYSIYAPSFDDEVLGYDSADKLNRKLIKDSAEMANSSFIDLSFKNMQGTASSRGIKISSKKDIYGKPDTHFNELGYYLASLVISDQIGRNSNLKFQSSLVPYNYSDFSINEKCPD